MTDELLEEQIRYYRARAPEYDETSPGDPFAEISARVTEELRGLGPVERAIELGAGTGQFTGDLATVARHLIAVDSSPETLAINAAKVPAGNVTRVVADVFDWRPSEPADLVAFRALHSHIPSDRLAVFWDAVADMLADDGTVVLVDESPHQIWAEEAAAPDALDDLDAPAGTVHREVVIRTLNDGRRFRIVKVLWDPAQLTARLAELGWEASFTRADPFFWGTVRRASAR
jgi:demethylmenaquinone methyltransferase/2-methoxy-6-polyprenyl-1,4-benzoquinol methylase